MVIRFFPRFFEKLTIYYHDLKKEAKNEWY